MVDAGANGDLAISNNSCLTSILNVMLNPSTVGNWNELIVIIIL